MTMSNDLDHVFPPHGEELLQQYLSGGLDDDEASELLRLLKSDDRFVDLAFENVQAEILLRQIANNHNVVDLFVETDLFQRTLEKEEKRNHPAAIPKKPLVPKKTGYLPWIAAGTIVVLFLVGIRSEFFSNPQTEATTFVPLAQITESVDAVWREGFSFKKGQDIGLEKLSLESGIVRIRFQNDVELAFEGPTELMIRDLDETFCQVGKLSATVPPTGSGFKIVTPIATVTDLGTQFSLRCDGETLDVQVVQGVVDVARSSSNKLRLETGLAALLDFRGGTKQFATDPQTFLSSDTIYRLWNDYLERRRPVWEEQKRRRSEDPALLASLDDAKMQGCRRTQGIYPDREAIELRSVRDGLELSVPGEHRNLTILAVVRIKEISQFNAVLCVGNAFPGVPGEFLWQVDRFGNLLFHVIHPKEIRRFEVPETVKRSDWKTWTFLAVVVDAEKREVRQYADGRRIFVQTWDDPIPLHMNSGTVGNGPSNHRDRAVRYWNGEIDTFDVYSRVFSDEEIALFHENMQ